MQQKSVAHIMGFEDWGGLTPGWHPGLYAAAHFMGLNPKFIFIYIFPQGT